MATFGTLQTTFQDGTQLFSSIWRKNDLGMVMTHLQDKLALLDPDKRSSLLSVIIENGHDIVIRAKKGLFPSEWFDSRTYFVDEQKEVVRIHFDTIELNWLDITGFLGDLATLLGTIPKPKRKESVLVEDDKPVVPVVDCAVDLMLQSKFGGLIRELTHTNRHSKRKKR